MIIDARTQIHPRFQPNSVAGAIFAAFETIEVGQSLDVHGVFNKEGRRLTKAQFRSSLSGLKATNHLNTKTYFIEDEKCFVVHKLELKQSAPPLADRFVEVTIDATRDWKNPHFRPNSINANLWHLLDAYELGVALVIRHVIKSNGAPGNTTTIRGAVRQLKPFGMKAYTWQNSDGQTVVRRTA
jgi:hypothetical protein